MTHPVELAYNELNNAISVNKLALLKKNKIEETEKSVDSKIEKMQLQINLNRKKINEYKRKIKEYESLLKIMSIELDKSIVEETKLKTEFEEELKELKYKNNIGDVKNMLGKIKKQIELNNVVIAEKIKKFKNEIEIYNSYVDKNNKIDTSHGIHTIANTFFKNFYTSNNDCEIKSVAKMSNNFKEEYNNISSIFRENIMSNNKTNTYVSLLDIVDFSSHSENISDLFKLLEKSHYIGWLKMMIDNTKSKIVTNDIYAEVYAKEFDDLTLKLDNAVNEYTHIYENIVLKYNFIEYSSVDKIDGSARDLFKCFIDRFVYNLD